MSEQKKSQQAPARKAPVIPADMKAFNEKLIAEFRANHGQFSGDMAGRSLLILTTSGARSGKPRSVVLGYGQHGDQIVVLASDNGAPSAPDWYHNLLADPTATVELAGPDRFQVRATTVPSDQREEFGKATPYLAQQQSLTKREIPVVVLDRV
jgi:deazaflavin-dependent oxidoreductase (nitroreductase family)